MRRRNKSSACRLFIYLVVYGGISAHAFSQFATTDATPAAAAYRAGQAALSRNDLAAAQAAFEQSLRIAPRNEPVMAALGVVLLRRGRDGRSGAHT